MQIADCISLLGEETSFEVLAKAKALEAQGIDMIHMEIGEPDFDTPQFIKDAAKKAIDDGYTHYTPSKGLVQVRETFADHISKTRGVPVTRSEIVITPGAKPIIFFGMMATLNPGDEVIYPDPGFPIYRSVISFLGAKPVALPLREENGFRFQHEDLWRLANEKTRMIILNSPQNPTGSVLTEHDLVVVSEVAKEYDCWVMSDEVYSTILFDGQKHQTIMALPGMKERTILVDGHSKTYAMTGWRIGYGVMPEGLTSHITTLMNNSASCTAAFTQIAGKAAYDGPQNCLEEMRLEFEQRRALIVDGLNSIPGVKCLKPSGAFYVFPNFKEFGWSSRDIETYLLQKAQVAALSGTAFGIYGEGYLRFSYACSKEKIEIAMDRLEKALANLPKLETYRQPIYAR
jgi:aspartate/methionine/tyrosine aminotransferase